MKKDIYEQIRKELVQYDLQSVADAAGLHISTLHYWITGTYYPSYESLIKIADALGYTIELKLRRRK